jgi:hypothetical protein
VEIGFVSGKLHIDDEIGVVAEGEIYVDHKVVALFSNMLKPPYSPNPIREQLALEFSAKTKRDAGRLMRKAAEVLNDKTWVKNWGKVEGGTMCLLSALNYTLCGNNTPKRTPMLAQQTGNLFCHWMGIDSIPLWNDAKDRTKEEVILNMRKFADEYDPQGGKP